MKKIFCIFSILALTVSCKGFLDEQKTTSLSDTDIYDTEEALETNVYGCYLTLHNTSLWKGTMAECLHTGSGLLIWGGQRTTDDWLDGMNFAKYSTTSSGNKSIWESVWAGINRCNRLLDNLPGSAVDEAFKTEVEAETRFVRAILYYTAVRLWGDVPLILTSPKETSQIHNPRTSFWLVYNQVIADLEYAETYMRDSARAEEVAPGKSRPNKWAATSLKASVYLTIGSLLSAPDDNFWDCSKEGRTPDFSEINISRADDAFTLAYNTAEKVITEGPYSLVGDYRTLFRWTEAGDWFLPENIIMLPSTDKAGSNFNSSRMLPQYPEGSSNYYTPNSNAGRVRPSRFGIENFIKYSGGRKGTQGTYNTKIYCSTKDPRYAATFFDSYKNLNTGKTIKTYPNDAYITNTSNAYFKKYLDPTYDVTNGKADFYLMRFAELYLISAEAAASLSSGPGDEMWEAALTRVNALRKRARESVDSGISAYPPNIETDTYGTKDELVNAIMWERFVEMSAEGHEWFDTHRRGASWLRDNIAVPANLFYMENEDMTSYWTYFYLGAESKGYIFPTDVQDLRKSLIASYPDSELRLNTSGVSQNDFYWQ